MRGPSLVVARRMCGRPMGAAAEEGSSEARRTPSELGPGWRKGCCWPNDGDLSLLLLLMLAPRLALPDGTRVMMSSNDPGAGGGGGGAAVSE